MSTKLKHFTTEQEALDWALAELLETLRDDLLETQQDDDDQEREKELVAKIADLEAITDQSIAGAGPVIITISGGNVQGVEKGGLEGLDVIIHDYDHGEEADVHCSDTPGVFVDGAGREYGKDANGRFYSIDLN